MLKLPKPKISVVIPVKNGAPWLHECLRGILGQSLASQTEIIAIDSGSSDDTLRILKNYPVRTFSVPAAEFNHGLTRQFGVERSRGEFVVMTVQDAAPYDELWLQKLLSGFEAAENVAGVCGNQVVRHGRDHNPVEWYRPLQEGGTEIYRYASAADFDALTPFEKKQACGWDDVTAMYRRDALLRIPFRKAVFGEDAMWAKDALRAGYTLVYNRAAKVYHWHHEDFDFAFRRSFSVMYMRYKVFGCVYDRPSQSLRQAAGTIKTIFRSEPLSLKEKLNWISYNRTLFKAGVRAYEVFAKALAKSEAELDAVYERTCRQSPVHQAKKSASNNPVAA